MENESLFSKETFSTISILVGWCAGRNPPFVHGRHSAERATRASRIFMGAYLPFHPAGRPFHRFQLTFSAPRSASWSFRFWAFRFCSVARALALHPCGCCSSAWWAEFPQALRNARRPSASSPTQNKLERRLK